MTDLFIKIEDEDKKSTNHRIVIFCCLLVCIIFIIYSMNNKDTFNNIVLDNNTINSDTKIIDNYLANGIVTRIGIPVEGSYIEVRNDTVKEIPINKIVIQTENNLLIPLLNYETIETKTGICFIYKIPNPTKITKIILDINIYNYYIDNLRTSKVSILNSDKSVVWNYIGIIGGSHRYVDIDIVEAIPVYNRPVNILGEEDQEQTLNNFLVKNTWY